MVLRELNLGCNVLRSNLGRLPAPYKLTFAVTYRCNSRCTTCGIWKKKPENELSCEEITEFFRKNNHFNWIDLTGGEIFLRPDIEGVFDAVVENSPRLHTLHFPTNGLATDRITEATHSLAKKAESRIIVTVSLDGSPQVHERIRGVLGGFGKAVETFRALSKIPKVKTYFGMTLSRENPGLVEETIASAQNYIPHLSHNDFHVNIAHSSKHYYGDDGAGEYDKKKAETDLADFLERKKGSPLDPVLFLERKYLTLAPKYLQSGATPLPCAAASASCFIDPQGSVYPCTMWDEKIGSLRETDFNLKKIWDNKQTQQTAENAKNKKCPNCWTPCEAYQTILGNLTRSDVLL
jgi:MoaA/NifB/PqqE/SkfB family radical SAM enzyme